MNHSKLTNQQPVEADRVALVTKSLALLIGVGGAAVLTGWALDIAVLKSVIPGLVAMNPLTAVLFLISALILGSRNMPGFSRITRQCLAAIIGLSAVSCLASYVTGQRGLDRLLFEAVCGDNRMAPNTALNFIFLAASYFAMDLQVAWRHRVSQGLALTVMTGATISLVGYIYGAEFLYGIGHYIPMAINTALLLAAAGLGVVIVQPDRGIARIILSPSAGGVMARTVLPAGIVIPVVIGLLRVAGQHSGYYDMEFGAALMVVSTVTLLSAAILFTAARLNNSDEERRRAERTVQLYADIVHHLPIGLTIFRLEDDADCRSLRFINANPASSTLLGVEVSHSIGQSISDAFPGVSRAELEVYSEVARTGNCREIPEHYYGDQRVAANFWSVKAFPLPDRCVGIAFENITERKRAQDQIRTLNQALEQRVEERTVELASANRDLIQKNQENEMFVYSVSHDLRSPLVTLQGFSKELGTVGAELLDVLNDPLVPEHVRKHASQLITTDMQQSLRFIQTGVMRLSGIIDALLRLSRVGRVEYIPRALDMNQVVGRVVELMSGELYERGVDIKVHELPSCYGDAAAIEQLFSNLIGNAVKYLASDRPGRIEIGALPSSEAPATATDGNESIYYVRDNGLGIPAAYYEKIFQSFQRVHPKHAPGEGMGLAIVRRIVQRHGGRVWVDSTEGQGSTFFVSLPRAAPCSLVSSTEHQPEGEDSHVRRTDGDLACRR